MRERTVLHFNVADFAVAVERVEDCRLRTRPLIIAPLQAARAVVYDMSEETYREGVRKGMPLRQATRICRAATVLPPRAGLYQKAMRAFFKEIQSYSPLLECGPADGHFFVDVTGTHRLHGPAPDIGWRVRRRARAGLGINPIWTLGSSKLVAKVASRLVKPVGEYIVNPGEEEAFLAPLPVEVLPGLTGRELQQLRDFRLNTIGALAGLSRHQLMVPFGGRCDYLHDISRGIDDTAVSPPIVAASIDYEHLFADDSNDQEEVEGVVATLVSRAGSSLRGRRQVARRVGLQLRYSDGRNVVRYVSCRVPTSGDFHLHKLALAALERAWTRRTRIRSCRLVCDQLQRQSPQLLLFPEPEGTDLRYEAELSSSTARTKLMPLRHKKVLAAMDALRNRFGHQVIGIGRQVAAVKNAG